MNTPVSLSGRLLSRPWWVALLALAAAAATLLFADTASRWTGRLFGPPPLLGPTATLPSTAAPQGSQGSQPPTRPADVIPKRVSRSVASPLGIVQLGAFSTSTAAQRHWEMLHRDVPTLRSLKPSFVPHRDLTRLRVTPVDEEAAATVLCETVIKAGYECFSVSISDK